MNSREEAMLARLVQRGVGNPSSMLPTPVLANLIDMGYVTDLPDQPGWVTSTELGKAALSVTVTLRGQPGG